MLGLSKVLISGPLAGFVGGFETELAELGYAPRSAEAQLRLMKHVSSWMASQGLAAENLSTEVVRQFVVHRRTHYRSMRSVRALVPLMSFLRRVGAAPVPEPATPVGPVEEVVARFGEYLRITRGLAAATVASYTSQATVFLRWRADRYGPEWGSLVAGQVHEFVAVRAAGQRPRSTQVGVNALRVLLRWMGAQRLAPVGLADGLGPVAASALAALPKALTDAQVGQLLTGLPGAGAARLRNEAMLALLWRLGLRAGEVARLRLDDIDWRRGVILVCGKGARHDQVPLPVDVGELLAAYLEHGRPRPVVPGHRQVFLALDAPHRPLRASAVSSVVARAAVAAGIEDRVGAHRLRHTTACRVLAGGGGLVETGQLLRHASVGATAVYAKVDIVALAVLARPWPGGGAR